MDELHSRIAELLEALRNGDGVRDICQGVVSAVNVSPFPDSDMASVVVAVWADGLRTGHDIAKGAEANSQSPLERYERRAHIAWHERKYPGAPNWPPYPSTNHEAAEVIAQYTGAS